MIPRYGRAPSVSLHRPTRRLFSLLTREAREEFSTWMNPPRLCGMPHPQLSELFCPQLRPHFLARYSSRKLRQRGSASWGWVGEFVVPSCCTLHQQNVVSCCGDEMSGFALSGI